MLSRKAGWLTVSREACFSRVGLACLVLGVGNTPAAARLGGGGCPRVVWGWHAVGVLGQCALVAWPVFCCLVCGWWGVGVGGLVVNCIVDASILL